MYQYTIACLTKPINCKKKEVEVTISFSTYYIKILGNGVCGMVYSVWNLIRPQHFGASGETWCSLYTKDGYRYGPLVLQYSLFLCLSDSTWMFDPNFTLHIIFCPVSFPDCFFLVSSKDMGACRVQVSFCQSFELFQRLGMGL